VKVRVNDPAGDVLVHLGAADYLRRYKVYVSHAQGWRQQFQKLESVDLRYDNQINVNPDMERVARTTPLSPASAKLSAAAGVKPAALLTRVRPGEPQVPKPAFEMTQKKLDSASATNATKPAAIKKPAAKPQSVKTAVASGKPAIELKNTGVPAKPVAQKKTAKKPVSHAAATHHAVAAKKTLVQSAKANAKPKPPIRSTGGQKPSAAIAKSQASQEPSD